MSNNKTHISEEKFRRYLANEMTNQERNAFEKELEKNPFEAEAMEGFAISSNNYQKDIDELRSTLILKRKNNTKRYYAVAATVLLLVTTGILLTQINQKNPVTDLSEVKVEKETTTEYSAKERAALNREKVTKAQETEDKELVVMDDFQEGIEVKQGQKAPVSVIKQEQNKVTPDVDEELLEEEIVLEIVDNEVQEDQEIIIPKNFTIPQSKKIKARAISVEKPKLAINKSARNNEITFSPKNKVIQGRVISSDDKMPIAGVTIVEKGTTNGIVTDFDGNFSLQMKNDSNVIVASFVGMETSEFSPNQDSNNLIALVPDQAGLDEVVVIGYGVSKKHSLTGSSAETDAKITNPKPVGGMSQYKTYLKSEAVLPTNYHKEKVVVKVMLHLNEHGRIDSVKNTNHSDQIFFERAKHIIMNGPDWKPKLEGANPAKSKVRLRVVFKKE